jgi:hypothetical protein
MQRKLGMTRRRLDAMPRELNPFESVWNITSLVANHHPYKHIRHMPVTMEVNVVGRANLIVRHDNDPDVLTHHITRVQLKARMYREVVLQ